MSRVFRKLSVAAVAAMATWVCADLSLTSRHDLTDFDPHEVARIETDMWRSYYDHQSARLFRQLTTLLRCQFHMPFWRSVQAAYRAARSAVVFQRGRGRPEYLRALPHLVGYYGLIRDASATPFDVEQVAALELEWWIVHRQRDRHPPGDLERALAELQAAVYHRPAAKFAEHARLRAEAMLLRDAGGDWRVIADLLDRSWVSLSATVGQRPDVPEHAQVDAVNDRVGPPAPVVGGPKSVAIPGGPFEQRPAAR